MMNPFSIGRTFIRPEISRELLWCCVEKKLTKQARQEATEPRSAPPSLTALTLSSDTITSRVTHYSGKIHKKMYVLKGILNAKARK